MDTYLVEFHTLRQKAEASMLMGSGVPDEFVSALCMEGAALSKNEKTLALSNPRNTLASPGVWAQMRRLFGLRGYASRQDVRVSAEMDAMSEEEYFEAWAEYRKAKRTTKDGKRGGDNGRPEKRRPSEQGRTRNGFNRRTEDRNRRYA